MNLDIVSADPDSPDAGFTVVENSGAGQQILTVTADDSGDITGGVSFSIAGADADSFNVDANTGVVTLLKTLILRLKTPRLYCYCHGCCR